MPLQKVQNYLVPAAGSVRGYDVSTVFSATPFPIDFRNQELDGQPFTPSGLFADNSAGAGDLIITIKDVNYTIAVPAGQRLQTQYPAPPDQKVEIIGNGQATVIFVDFPVIPFNPSLGGSSSSVTVANLPSLGQKPMAGSLPVVLPSDQIVSEDFTPANTGAQTSVAGSAASVTLLSANAARKGAFIVNDSTVNLYVRLQAAAASTANYSVKLGPGDTLALSRGDYAGEIRGIWDSATGNARVTEIS